MASRVAVVFGIGPGIGGAVAHKFAAEGYTVALLGRKKEKLEEFKAQIEGKKGKAFVVVSDAADPASIAAAFEAIRKVGHPEVLVYNASGFKIGSLLDTSLEEFENNWKVSARAAFLASKEVLPKMVENKKGTIIYTGATASLRGGANFSAFASGKFALRALSQSVAREFGPKGIHVAHTIIDGGVDTAHTGKETVLSPKSIADSYWNLHTQHHTAWTQELDFRPFVEKW